MKNAVVIYETLTGNTRKAGERIANPLPHVARQVQQDVFDAVGRLERPPPDVAVCKLVEAMRDLC